MIDQRQTKWTVFQERLAAARSAVQDLEDEIMYMETTPFTSNGTGECSKCGTHLATEADFAKHFDVPDARLYNLGTCPGSGE